MINLLSRANHVEVDLLFPEGSLKPFLEDLTVALLKLQKWFDSTESTNARGSAHLSSLLKRC